MKSLDLITKQGRLEELLTSNLENIEATTDFNEIADMVAAVCKVPIAVIFFTDDFRQSFISKKGIPFDESPAILSLCRHAVKHTESFFEVKDIWQDEQLMNHPLATGSLQIRYYASAVVKNFGGKNSGIICVISDKPNALNEEQKAFLQRIAKFTGKLMEASSMVKATKEYHQHLAQQLESEKNVLNIIQYHVLKPVESLKTTVELCGFDGLDDEKLAIRELLSRKLNNTIETIQNVLEWGDVLVSNKYQKQISEVKVHDVVKEVLQGFLIQATLKNNRLLNLTDETLTLKSDVNILKFILKNLISNANSVTDSGSVTVYAEEDVDHIMLSVCDSGKGLTKEQLKNIFTNNSQVQDCSTETDIDLSYKLAKDFVKELNATIQVKSELGEGTAIFLYFAK